MRTTQPFRLRRLRHAGRCGAAAKSRSPASESLGRWLRSNSRRCSGSSAAPTASVRRSQPPRCRRARFPNPCASTATRLSVISRQPATSRRVSRVMHARASRPVPLSRPTPLSLSVDSAVSCASGATSAMARWWSATCGPHTSAHTHHPICGVSARLPSSEPVWARRSRTQLAQGWEGQCDVAAVWKITCVQPLRSHSRRVSSRGKPSCLSKHNWNEGVDANL